MRTRLDHGRMYMWIMGGLFTLSMGLVIYGPIPNTSLSELPNDVQNLLNLAMFLGSSICIYGILRGEYGLVARKGDIRVSYNLAISGAPAVVASLGTYCYALFDAGNFVPSALSAVISVAIIGGTIQNVWDFRNERNRITRNIELLRKQQNEALGSPDDTST